jgi:hypothetical protein
MDQSQTQYFYMVELGALEEQLSHSRASAARLREKAMKRRDFEAADQVNRIQRVFDVVQRRIARMK